MNLRIIPVVEFEPFNLGMEDFGELVQQGSWAAHWSGVLAAFGLRPIEPGSWFVATSEFREDAAFEILLRTRLTENRPPFACTIPPLDEISPILGGYAFSHDGLIQLEPGCCCDLSDLSAWTAAFREGKATPLGIGHRCFSLSTDESSTTVTLSTEVTGHEEVCLRYPSSDFSRALEQAELQQKQFAESLKTYLLQFAPNERVDDLVAILVFGSYP